MSKNEVSIGPDADNDGVMNRPFLIQFRSIIIQLLNLLDDELGFPRTIPPKSERRRLRLEMIAVRSVEE